MNNLELYIEATKKGFTPISYSQISLFAACPHSWKLQYIDKLKRDQKSIHLVFGSSIHSAVQKWLDLLYNNPTELKSFDSFAYLGEQLMTEYNKASNNGTDHFSNPEQLHEFYLNGCEILKFIAKEHAIYFPTKNYNLVGCEIPLLQPLDVNNKVALMGFIDIVIQDVANDKYIIYDFKSSTNGWNEYDKKDFIKAVQILAYKKYYAKQFNVSQDKIDVEFLILRRKLPSNGEFDAKRIQRHKPASGTTNMKKMDMIINNFVESVFDSNGKVKSDIEFSKASNPKACQWCKFKETKYCDVFD